MVVFVRCVGEEAKLYEVAAVLEVVLVGGTTKLDACGGFVVGAGAEMEAVLGRNKEKLNAIGLVLVGLIGDPEKLNDCCLDATSLLGDFSVWLWCGRCPSALLTSKALWAAPLSVRVPDEATVA